VLIDQNLSSGAKCRDSVLSEVNINVNIFSFKLNWNEINKISVQISVAPYDRNIRGAEHVCELNDLPRVDARQRGGRESNPRRVDHCATEPHSLFTQPIFPELPFG